MPTIPPALVFPASLVLPDGVGSFLAALVAMVVLPLAIFAVGHLFDTYLMDPWDGTDPEAGLDVEDTDD